MKVEGNYADSGYLFMSNHQFPVRLWPALIQFQNVFNNTVYICDAPFALFLNSFNLPTLCTDTSKYINTQCDRKSQIKHLLISALGKITTRNIKTLDGDSLVSKACNLLEKRTNVFIFPSTITSKTSKWRSGLGRIVKQIDVDNVGAGFVYIPKNISRETEVFLVTSLTKINPHINQPEPKNISLELKLYHQSIYANRL